MLDRKSILSLFALVIVSLFLISEYNFLFGRGDLSENRIDREFEKSAEEVSEIDFFERSFTDFGGDDFQVYQEIKFSFLRFKQPSEQRLLVSSKRCYHHSLIILYCCLKIPFC